MATVAALEKRLEDDLIYQLADDQIKHAEKVLQEARSR